MRYLKDCFYFRKVMERIRLTKTEKKIFLQFARYGEDYLREAIKDDVRTALRGLDSKGLMRCAFVEGGDIEDVRLTNAGRDYLSANPKLRNPVQWSLVWSAVAAIAAVISALVAVAVLVIACSMIK